MAGGKNNIKPEDGKQFSSEYQPEEKWTEEKALELAQGLIKWITEKDAEGEDKGNIFFEEYIVIERDLYPTLTAYLCKKFTSFSKLIGKAKKIQEIKLYKYGAFDKLNANMTKFVLINEHDKTSEKTQNKNENTNKEVKIVTRDDDTNEALKDFIDNDA